LSDFLSEGQVNITILSNALKGEQYYKEIAMIYATEAMVKIIKILSQAGFAPLLGSLPAFRRCFFICLIVCPLSPDMIELAKTAPPEELSRYTFLQMVAGGNPVNIESLNDLVLDEIIDFLVGYI
jgi:hypothetical protein